MDKQSTSDVTTFGSSETRPNNIRVNYIWRIAMLYFSVLGMLHRVATLKRIDWEKNWLRKEKMEKRRDWEMNRLRKDHGDCPSFIIHRFDHLDLFGLVSILAPLNLGGSQSIISSIYSFLNLLFSQSLLFSICFLFNMFFSQSVVFSIYSFLILFFSRSILFSIHSFLNPP